MPFSLPQLPYAYDALEPHIDARTMEIHHTKHHQAYIDKLNAALEAHSDLADQSIETLLTDLNKIPEDIRPAVQNHGGGYANHNLFWTIMGPNGGGEPSGQLADAINQHWENFSSFKEAFSTAATGVFGSGWAWLVTDADQKPSIITTPNQNSPISQGLIPLLGLDVWEHAYYLNYQNKRPDYIAAWWNVVDWAAVANRYDSL